MLLVALLVGICLICLIAGQLWMAHQFEKKAIEGTHSFITLSEAITDNSIKQAMRLAQMLALDLDISKFIYQGPIDTGSSDIQTMIDALWKLPTSRNVNPIISDILIFSRSSGYLLNSTNLFFDLDKMYALFQFDDLSSLQFKSKYLTTKESGFFPTADAIVDGRHTRVIPYMQTFPLSNQSANTGKIILLLNQSFIADQLGAIENGNKKSGWYSVLDAKGNIITSSDSVYVSSSIPTTLPDGPHRNVNIDGERFFVSVITSPDTGLKYICAIKERDFRATMKPILFIMTLGVTAILVLSLFFAMRQFYRSQRNWNKLNSLIGNSTANTSYELIADTIASILEEDRRTDSKAGRKALPFKYDSLFKRYIQGKVQSERELKPLFEEIQGRSMDTSTTYRLMKIVINEDDFSTDIDDLDFLRIAVDREASEIFQDNCHVFIDFSFNAWILSWDSNETTLNGKTKLFWSDVCRIIPFEISLAVSSAKTDLKGLIRASFECSAVADMIKDSSLHSTRMDYDELANRTDSYLYTKEMERVLTSAISAGDPKATNEALETIYAENFSKRRLSPQNALSLKLLLHATAVRNRLRQGNNEMPNRFKHFSSAREFFMAEAGQSVLSKKEVENSIRSTIMAYIDENYSNPLLNLSVAASDLQMKENQLYHFMSTRMGKTFASYLEEYRLDMARHMLEEEQSSAINAIALKCGYTNPQTFRRAFTKRFGQLPSDFRNSVSFKADP